MSEWVSNGGLQCHAQLPLYREQHNPAISTYLLTYLEEEDVGPQVTRKGVLARVGLGFGLGLGLRCGCGFGFGFWFGLGLKLTLTLTLTLTNPDANPDANPNANPNP